jgi:hypothetical protein
MTGDLFLGHGVTPAQDQDAQQSAFLAADSFLSRLLVRPVTGGSLHDLETHAAFLVSL